jgi:hypothetical protein
VVLCRRARPAGTRNPSARKILLPLKLIQAISPFRVCRCPRTGYAPGRSPCRSLADPKGRPPRRQQWRELNRGEAHGTRRGGVSDSGPVEAPRQTDLFKGMGAETNGDGPVWPDVPEDARDALVGLTTQLMRSQRGRPRSRESVITAEKSALIMSERKAIRKRPVSP